jgi:hypothetical protein
VQRHESRLGAEAEQSEEKRHRSPDWGEMRTAHRLEGELPAAALHDTESKQDGDRADVSHQQVEKSRPTNFGETVLGGHEEVRGQRHGLPGHHERVGIVGEEQKAHACEKEVVLETQQARRGAVAAPEIPCCKH